MLAGAPHRAQHHRARQPGRRPHLQDMRDVDKQLYDQLELLLKAKELLGE
jgi:hypothetical protein